jgi:hypothetical protein
MPAQAEKEREARLRERERERERRGFGFCFFNFMIFKTSHKQAKSRQQKDDAQALIASKIIKMIFKYLKAKFI